MAKKVISFINMKGGVGKTTTAVGVAQAYAYSNPESKVLLIDLDPQANATLFCMDQIKWEFLDNEGMTTLHLFQDYMRSQNVSFNLNSAITQVDFFSDIHNFYILASNVRLIYQISTLFNGQCPNGTPKELILLDALERADIFEEYEYIIIDEPPSLDIMSQNGLAVSNEYVIPTIPDYVSGLGLPSLQIGINLFATRLRTYTRTQNYTINPQCVVYTKMRYGNNKIARDQLSYFNTTILSTLNMTSSPTTFTTLNAFSAAQDNVPIYNNTNNNAIPHPTNRVSFYNEFWNCSGKNEATTFINLLSSL